MQISRRRPRALESKGNLETHRLAYQLSELLLDSIDNHWVGFQSFVVEACLYLEQDLLSMERPVSNVETCCTSPSRHL